jgi:hypothetical protein
MATRLPQKIRLNGLAVLKKIKFQTTFESNQSSISRCLFIADDILVCAAGCLRSSGGHLETGDLEISFLRSYINSSSASERNVTATPVFPARPVRPMIVRRHVMMSECKRNRETMKGKTHQFDVHRPRSCLPFGN